MTEAEWLACTESVDPEVTRDAMMDEIRGKASVRKRRLFTCACCRAIFPAFAGERSRKAVEVAERFADGEATGWELEQAQAAAGRAVDVVGSDWMAQATSQCHILRDIFGNPFRPVTINPAWLTWNDGTVVKLAQAIYDERTFDRMPVLADALEDAGCTDPAILGHCRQPGGMSAGAGSWT
jgi:hypothetical protein